MSTGEITFRAKGVALLDTFAIEPNKDPNKAASVVGRVRILDGERAGKDVFFRGYLGDGKPQEITMQQLRAMGWSDNDITKLTGLGSTIVDVVGKSRAADNGKVYTDYSFYEPKPPRETLRDEDKRDFAKRFKALAATMPVVKVTAANAAPAQLPVAQLDAAAAEFPPSGSPM